jgi:hypothetical protein
VSPNYFATLGARLLRGRYFTEADGDSAPPVTIANRAFARTYFPNEDAVGKQIVEHSGSGVTIPIVGVMDDIREGPLDEAIPPVLYFPFDQRTDDRFALVVRAAGGEQGLLPAMAGAIRKIDRGIVTRDGMTMREKNPGFRFRLHAPFLGVAGGSVRRGCATAKRGGPLRSGGLFSEPAPP